MAKIVIEEMIRLGLVKGHQATIYEAYESYENGNVSKPLFLSGEDTINLTELTFPLKYESGEYFPPEKSFVARVRIKADDKYTDWFYALECTTRCTFDYTLPIYFCNEEKE